jgi:thiosulfate/3-mercaptopyruvate sulfurtransferase
MRKYGTPAVVLTFLLTLCIYPVLSSAQTQESQRTVDKIVRAEWLAANLTNPNVRIIDMREEIRLYWESHLPGALFLDSAALRWTDHGVPGKLMPAKALVTLLGEMGIRPNTLVVVYTEINNYRGTYLIWALDYIGHKSSAILEGGFDGWKNAARPLTQDYPSIMPVEYHLPLKLHEEIRATTDEVKKREPATTALIDTRPPDLFSGEKGAWKRKGHIIGAIPHFWAVDLKTDGSWLPLDVLERGYASLGATPDKTIYIYCGQGQMASHVYFTLRYILGFPKVKNYDGSFSEWSNRDDLPVEQTPKK